MCQSRGSEVVPRWWPTTAFAVVRGGSLTTALSLTAINISRLAGHTNIAAAQRRYSWAPATAVEATVAA